MPDIIRLLPDSIANQIAAGEVIQRPASVVKELVENAIDAGATRIRLDLLEAGRELIRVSDNGHGMSATDARMSFERHATSKIAQVDDLFTLRTMGFRGEALASIAAVAQVEVTTRTESDEIGTHLIISGSVVEVQEPTTAAVGSTFSIKNLFFNVPARRKFLKNNETELRSVLTEMERIVLVNPDISFDIHHTGKLQQQMPAAPLKARILDALGRRLERDLVPVQMSSTVVDIDGYIGKPDGAKRRGAKQFFFVNGRYMRHPFFHKAVLSAYEHILPPGVQPNYFLYLRLDPAHIDVNIHPAKTEIKFADELTIFKFLGSLCREGLASTHAVPTIDFDRRHIIDIPVYKGADTLPVPLPSDEADPNYNPFTSSEDPLALQSPIAVEAELPLPSKPTISWANLFKQFDAKRQSTHSLDTDAKLDDIFPKSSGYPPSSQSSSMQDSQSAIESSKSIPELFEQSQERPTQLTSPLCYIYKGRYIVTSLSNGLALVDFHRADMRIIYDRFLTDANHGRIEQQRLLFPEEIILSPSDVSVAQGILEEMKRYGFEFVYQTDTSYSITAAPAMIVDKAAEITAEVLDASIEDQKSAANRIVEHIALSLARKRAIPYGKDLSREDASRLLAKLFNTAEPTFSPDGRLILSIIDESDIERRFNLQS